MRSFLLDIGASFLVLALIGVTGWLLIFGGHWLYDALLRLFN